MTHWTAYIGIKRHRLTPLSLAGHSNSGGAILLFDCECGNQHRARATDWRAGHVKSCGCLRLEQIKEIIGGRGRR